MNWESICTSKYLDFQKSHNSPVRFCLLIKLSIRNVSYNFLLPLFTLVVSKTFFNSKAQAGLFDTDTTANGSKDVCKVQTQLTAEGPHKQQNWDK